MISRYENITMQIMNNNKQRNSSKKNNKNDKNNDKKNKSSNSLQNIDIVYDDNILFTVPKEIFYLYCTYLDIESLIKLGYTCKYLNKYLKYDFIWQRRARNIFYPIQKYPPQRQPKKISECRRRVINYYIKEKIMYINKQFNWQHYDEVRLQNLKCDYNTHILMAKNTERQIAKELERKRIFEKYNIKNKLYLLENGLQVHKPKIRKRKRQD